MDWLRHWWWAHESKRVNAEIAERTEYIHGRIKAQRPMPTAHPDQFTSLTPEERRTWHDLEALLQS